MQIDLLELAIPDLRGVEVVPITTAWGPSESAFCYVSGTPIGGLSADRFGRDDRFLPELADFRVIQLAPMLRLPAHISGPATAQLLDALRSIVSSFTRWVVWCEPDADQAPLSELSLEPDALIARLEIALQPGPLDARTFIGKCGL